MHQALLWENKKTSKNYIFLNCWKYSNQSQKNLYHKFYNLCYFVKYHSIVYGGNKIKFLDCTLWTLLGKKTNLNKKEYISYFYDGVGSLTSLVAGVLK